MASTATQQNNADAFVDVIIVAQLLHVMASILRSNLTQELYSKPVPLATGPDPVTAALYQSPGIACPVRLRKMNSRTGYQARHGETSVGALTTYIGDIARTAFCRSADSRRNILALRRAAWASQRARNYKIVRTDSVDTPKLSTTRNIAKRLPCREAPASSRAEDAAVHRAAKRPVRR